MSQNLSTRLLFVFLFIFTSVGMVLAEDWTVSGKTYSNITVTKVDADKVHIIYDGGIGSINLADLTPELQKRFNFDPKAAAQAQAVAQQAANNVYNTLKRQNAILQAEDNSEKKAKIVLINKDIAALQTKLDQFTRYVSMKEEGPHAIEPPCPPELSNGSSGYDRAQASVEIKLLQDKISDDRTDIARLSIDSSPTSPISAPPVVATPPVPAPPVAPPPKNVVIISPDSTNFISPDHAHQVEQPAQPTATSAHTSPTVFVPPYPIPAQGNWTWTVVGREYRNVVVTKIEADTVSISYDGGLGRVNQSDLTPELQKMFHYDPQAAARASKEKAAALAQAEAIQAPKLAAKKEQIRQEDADEAQKQIDEKHKFDSVAIRNQIAALEADIEAKKKIMNHDYMKDAQNGESNKHSGYQTIIDQEQSQIWALEDKLNNNGANSP